MSGFVHVARSCVHVVLLRKTSELTLYCHVIHIKNMDGGMHYYEALMIIGAQGSVSTPGPTCSESLGATSETSSSASESVHVSQLSQHLKHNVLVCHVP